MKRLVLSVAALLSVLVCAAPVARAQGTGGFQFGVSGGVSVPTSDTSNAFGKGYHGGIVLNYELPALPIGIRVDGDYHHFDANSQNASSGSAQLIDGNANLVLGIRILLVKVYALGGAGLYSVKFSGSTGAFSLSGTTAGASSFSGSQTDFGWNAGAGVAFVVGKVSIFGEGRYHEVTLDNSAGKFRFVAATAGVLF